MKTVEYLDLARKKANIPSDYALAKRLGISAQAVSAWRSKTRPRYPEVLHACLLAELCEMDPVLVLADIEVDKATHYEKSHEVTAWHNLLTRMTGVAASVLLGTVLASPSPAQSQTKTDPRFTSVYIVSSQCTCGSVAFPRS